jgi:hypothetical protein
MTLSYILAEVPMVGTVPKERGGRIVLTIDALFLNIGVGIIYP